MYNDSLFTQNRDALYSLVADTSDIGIILSENQTLDSMAAALSFYLSLQAAGKNIEVVSKREPIVELSNLVGVDRLKQGFSGKIKMLVLSIPFREGEVEKVSFNTEEGRMNFNITGGENGITPFEREDIRITRRGSNPQVLITLGISDVSELAGLVEVTPDTKIINIDNNPQNTHFGTVVLVDPTFSSLSEVIVKLILDLALPADVDIAQNLMDGISAATNNFSAPNTSLYAFESAGFLLREGAKRRVEGARTPQFREQRFPRRVQAASQNPQVQEVSEPQPGQTQVQSQASASQQYDQASQLAPDSSAAQDESVPSDWFVPKVFKGSKKPQ